MKKQHDQDSIEQRRRNKLKRKYGSYRSRKPSSASPAPSVKAATPHHNEGDYDSESDDAGSQTIQALDNILQKISEPNASSDMSQDKKMDVLMFLAQQKHLGGESKRKKAMAELNKMVGIVSDSDGD